MSERDKEEVHLLEWTSMTTQHQVYTRNKMAVKIWKSAFNYTQKTLIHAQVTILIEQIIVENVCVYLIMKRDSIQAPANTNRMNWSVATFWQDWLLRLMSICCSSLQQEWRAEIFQKQLTVLNNIQPCYRIFFGHGSQVFQKSRHNLKNLVWQGQQ
jgi:hypothetical protein